MKMNSQYQNKRRRSRHTQNNIEISSEYKDLQTNLQKSFISFSNNFHREVREIRTLVDLDVHNLIENSKRKGDDATNIQIELDPNGQSTEAEDDVKDCNISCLNDCNKVAQAFLFTESQRLKQIESDLLKITDVALGDESFVLNDTSSCKKREVRIPFTKLENLCRVAQSSNSKQLILIEKALAARGYQLPKRSDHSDLGYNYKGEESGLTESFLTGSMDIPMDVSILVGQPLGRLSEVEYETDTVSKIGSTPGSISTFDKYGNEGKQTCTPVTPATPSMDALHLSACTSNVLKERIDFEKYRSPVDSELAQIMNKHSCYEEKIYNHTCDSLKPNGTFTSALPVTEDNVTIHNYENIVPQLDQEKGRTNQITRHCDYFEKTSGDVNESEDYSLLCEDTIDYSLEELHMMNNENESNDFTEDSQDRQSGISTVISDRKKILTSALHLTNTTVNFATEGLDSKKLGNIRHLQNVEQDITRESFTSEVEIDPAKKISDKNRKVDLTVTKTKEMMSHVEGEITKKVWNVETNCFDQRKSNEKCVTITESHKCQDDKKQVMCSSPISSIENTFMCNLSLGSEQATLPKNCQQTDLGNQTAPLESFQVQVLNGGSNCKVTHIDREVLSCVTPISKKLSSPITGHKFTVDRQSNKQPFQDIDDMGLNITIQKNEINNNTFSSQMNSNFEKKSSETVKNYAFLEDNSNVINDKYILKHRSQTEMSYMQAEGKENSNSLCSALPLSDTGNKNAVNNVSDMYMLEKSCEKESAICNNSQVHGSTQEYINDNTKNLDLFSKKDKCVTKSVLEMNLQQNDTNTTTQPAYNKLLSSRTPLAAAWIAEHMLDDKDNFLKVLNRSNSSSSTPLEQQLNERDRNISESERIKLKTSLDSIDRSYHSCLKVQFISFLSETEYEAAPGVVKMQVSVEEVNQAADILNVWFQNEELIDSALRKTIEEDDAYQILENKFERNKSRSILLALCHFQRIIMQFPFSASKRRQFVIPIS